MATNQEMLTWTYQKVTSIIDTILPALPGKVWAVTIRRGGQNVSALQELANANTSLEEVHKKLDAIIAKQNEGA